MGDNSNMDPFMLHSNTSWSGAKTINSLHCYELTTIGLFLALCLSEWLQLRGKTAVSSLWHQKKCLLRHKKSKKVKKFKALTGIAVHNKNELLGQYLISLKKVNDPVQLLESKRNAASIVVWTRKLSEKKVCCNKFLFSCITNHLHFKAISSILSICQKLQTHQNIQNSCESSGKNKSKPFPINKSANDKSSQPYKNKCNEKIPESTFSLTLLTPLGYVMVSDLPDRLSYSEIISVITRYTEIPPKLLNLVVGNRKLMANDILDLKVENFINVYVKGFGGGGKDSSANSDTNEKHNCKKCSI